MNNRNTELLFKSLKLSSSNRDISKKNKKFIVDGIKKLNSDVKINLVNILKEWYKNENLSYPYNDGHVNFDLDLISIQLRWIILNFLKIYE